MGLTANLRVLVALHAALNAQGDTIRDLKSSKADKQAIGAEVDTLMKLKVSLVHPRVFQTLGTQLPLQAEFKALTGTEYNRDKPPAASSAAAAAASAAAQGVLLLSALAACVGLISGHCLGDAEAILAKVNEQSGVVRDLKTKKADAALIKAAVDTLLALKVVFPLQRSRGLGL